MLKRIFSLVLLLSVMALPMFAGGAQPAGTGEVPTIRIVVYDESDTDWNPNLWTMEQLAKAGGVKFDFLAIAGTDFIVKRNAWIASGDLPDIWQDRVENPKDMVDVYGPKGIFVPVNKHYDKLPNLNVYRKKYPEYDKVMQSSDGNAYAVGYVYDYVPFGKAPSIREYILNEKGIDSRKDIQTMDDLYNALKVIKKYDMDTKGENNYPWANRDGEVVENIGSMWGVGQWMFYDDTAGRYDFGPMNPRFKPMVEFFLKCYQEGLMHPDIWTMPDEVMEGNSRQEKVHFWVDNIWNGYHWGLESPSALEMTTHPFKPILPPKVDGKRYFASRAGSSVNNTQLWLISAKTKYLDNILKMIDWGFSDEGKYAMAMGKENYTYVVDKNGLRVWPAPGLFDNPPSRAFNPETGEAKNFENVTDANWTPPAPWQKIGQDVFKSRWRAFRNFNNFVYPVETSIPTMYQAAPVMFADKEWMLKEGVIANPEPATLFNKEALDRRKVIQTPIETYSDEMIVKFTTGVEPMSKWNDFITRLKSMGAEELIKIYNEAIIK